MTSTEMGSDGVPPSRAVESVGFQELSTFRPGFVVAAPKITPPNGTLSGKVTDATGRTMPGVTVGLFRGDATEAILETVTDGEGSFSFGSVVGRYRIVASVLGFARYEETLSVVPGMKPLAVTLDPGASRSIAVSDREK